MRVSGLDSNGDWRFGKGKANYLRRSDAIKQNVITRLRSFTDDWFLDITAGLPWINMLGSRNNEARILREIERRVLATEGVRTIELIELIDIDENRKATIHISLIDIYGDQHDEVVIFTPEPAPPTPTSATITIPSGAVGSDLTDFVSKLYLGDLDAAFWAAVKSDGGDIRITDSSFVTIPHDVVWIDTTLQLGVVYFKSDLLASANNVFHITYGDSGLSKLAATDPNGRNAVWSDYGAVVLGAELTDRTGGGNDMVLYGDATALTAWTNVRKYAIDGAISGHHQGVAWDGTYWYITDTNGIRKYDSSWVLQTSNMDPIDAAGLTGSANHCGDPCVYGGELYIPMEAYPAVSDQYVVVFNLSDLSYNRKYDVTTYDHEMSSIDYWDTEGVFVISDYTDSYTIHTYSTDFSSHNTITLDTAVANAQGIAARNNYVLLNSNGAGLYHVLADGTVTAYASTYFTPSEGLCFVEDRIYAATQSGNNVYEGLFTTYFYFDGLNDYGKIPAPTLTTWTMGASIDCTYEYTANNGILSYSTDDSNNANRASLLLDNGNTLALWNSSDSWYYPGITVYAYTEHRLVAMQDGTTSRKVSHDGTVYTDPGAVAQRPAGIGHVLWVGVEDASLAEEFKGYLDEIFLRTGNFSDNWVAAEYASWKQSTTFYTIS